MRILASNLRRRAKELGISHAEAARRAGLSETRYGHYVTGRREPDLATLVRIAKVLKTSPNLLLSFRTGSDEADSVVKQRIWTAAHSLSDEDLETLALIVEALAERRAKR